MEQIDNFLWLEDINSTTALHWVEQQTTSTLEHFEQSCFFPSAQEYLEAILGDKNLKLTLPFPLNNEIHRIEKNSQHPKGLWQKTSVDQFLAPITNWETILDIDLYCQDPEKQSWIIHSMDSIEISQSGERAMILFSVGGGDSGVWQEFDLVSKQFVSNGFTLPNAKSSVGWLDQDTILFTLASQEYGQTSCGYPYKAYTIKRGQPLSQAPVLYSAPESIMSIWVMNHHDISNYYSVLREAHSFHTCSYHLIRGKQLSPIPLPHKEFRILATSSNFIFFSSLQDGALYSIAIKDFTLTKIFTPTDREFLEQYIITPLSDSKICYTTLNNVVHHCYIATYQDGKWAAQELKLPTDCSISYLCSIQDKIFMRSESFLNPPTLYRYDINTEQLRILQAQPKLFSTDNFVTQQRWATSRDGTKIPYFCIRKKDQQTTAPTILNGYGGFNIALTPFYLREFGKLWLEQGGVFVVANIRGGGEFGPAWHQAAIKTKRQNSFDDFIAVAEDLIDRQITTAEQLGIIGASNGGLLTSTVMTQRPELFSAACIGVPLTDMLRFHKLLAGSSWIDEYGDPDNEQERAVLKAYSPYHNLKKDKTYPQPMFMTSKTDDRVHPGHARKMAAKMEELGHPFYFYENSEGGHGGSSDYKQRAKWIALELSYFHERLVIHNNQKPTNSTNS